MSGWLIGILCFVIGFVVGAGLFVLVINSIAKDFGDALKEGWK